MLDHGDNPRFLIPMQSLVVLIVLWWLVNLNLFEEQECGLT